MPIKKLIASAILALTLAMPANASVLISFAGGSSPTDGVDGNIRTYTTGGLTVQASGWTLSGNSLGTSWLGQYSNGLGVTNDAESGWTLLNPYGIDNSNGLDFVLLVFSEAVTLQSAILTPVQAAWTPADNDVTASFANAAGAFTPNPTAMSVTNPAWLDLVAAAYSGSGNTNSPFMTSLSSGENYANVWLIAASADNRDYRTDGFQLTSITVGSRAVPEPSTWTMMLLGFGVAGHSLRKRSRRAAKIAQIA
jgi:hypothetical protein